MFNTVTTINKSVYFSILKFKLKGKCNLYIDYKIQDIIVSTIIGPCSSDQFLDIIVIYAIN